MTEICHYICPKCRFERTLAYGTLWRHVDGLHRYRRAIQRGEYGETAQKGLDRNPTALLTVFDAIFQCRRCQTIHTAEYIALKAAAFSWEKPVRCPSCHAPCQKLAQPPAALPCTACGGKGILSP